MAVTAGLIYFLLYKRPKYVIGTLTGSLTVVKERLIALPLPKRISYPAAIGRITAEAGTAILEWARSLVSKRQVIGKVISNVSAAIAAWARSLVSKRKSKT